MVPSPRSSSTRTRTDDVVPEEAEEMFGGVVSDEGMSEARDLVVQWNLNVYVSPYVVGVRSSPASATLLTA